MKDLMVVIFNKVVRVFFNGETVDVTVSKYLDGGEIKPLYEDYYTPGEEQFENEFSLKCYMEAILGKTIEKLILESTDWDTIC